MRLPGENMKKRNELRLDPQEIGKADKEEELKKELEAYNQKGK